MLRLQVWLLALVVTVTGLSDSYYKARQAFIDEELAMRVGAKQILNRKEQTVNKFLMNLKNQTIQQSIWTTTPYPPAISFFKSKPWIDNSTIYKIIKMMPKGGVLHLHDSAMTSLDWVIKTLTHLPNLYTRVEPGRYPTRKYKFSDTPPGLDWQSMDELRSAANDPDEFDEQLIIDTSIWVKDPFQAYPSVNDVWGKFETYFSSMKGLVAPPENLRSYLERGIREFYDDGVQYIEMKTGTKSDANGNDATEAYLELVLDIVNQFKSEHPDFIGVKIIIAGRRGASSQADNIKKTVALMKKYPDLIKGFDLLQQEDNTHWTVEFANELLSEEDGQSRAPFFFHSGETDWTQWVDFNLVDSVLMNATRIGHGYAVYHHPKVMQAVLKNQIAVELNPISNQVLGLINDLRNHPGAYLIANGAPVVISSDDPPVWLSTPLSHDFYMTFMALGAVHDDLRLLKQLAINSITYSTMTSEEKAEAYDIWQFRWDEFIDAVITKYSLKFGLDMKRPSQVLGPLTLQATTTKSLTYTFLFPFTTFIYVFCSR
ncbi:adenosine deaminase cecr1 [Biomphalaria glabrata]|nr:adenosine deaminase AGSA-like isoform X2 [Biomphalaria glabrata]XP_055890783.1 adenosine deaminase AGSA-like isoform X2 [Biomphalaria glabrata]XP_055890784.1 adenosine deaminase AGSA-like isoform X2 [Biomphalaria glabrata]XP_055890785.1 adenosine deaminase AGSA-like isoform X2 [Biomphalaria glabrata]XP_055890786.1 adenosine deaminase AGSA-like isoform X2 [Biomphalaria glabrata]XP_055890787.1 adenosine deaminase AGSA-like isoform X2 [Biomphalaria glabrata]XP_055890788.1 adenosine deaminase 